MIKVEVDPQNNHWDPSSTMQIPCHPSVPWQVWTSSDNRSWQDPRYPLSPIHTYTTFKLANPSDTFSVPCCVKRAPQACWIAWSFSSKRPDSPSLRARGLGKVKNILPKYIDYSEMFISPIRRISSFHPLQCHCSCRIHWVWLLISPEPRQEICWQNQLFSDQYLRVQLQ